MNTVIEPANERDNNFLSSEGRIQNWISLEMLIMPIAAGKQLSRWSSLYNTTEKTTLFRDEYKCVDYTAKPNDVANLKQIMTRTFGLDGKLIDKKKRQVTWRKQKKGFGKLTNTVVYTDNVAKMNTNYS